MQLLRLALRRWYVVILVAATTVAALALTMRQEPVFYTRFELVLLGPRPTETPNKLSDPAFRLAPLAGVLVHDVNGDSDDAGMASTDTTLYGEGVRRGARVRAPSTGTQWQPIYDQPNIIVDAVAEDPATVLRDAERLVREVRESLDRRQDALGVPAATRVRLLESPADPVVVQVGGSPMRAAAALLAVGISVAVLLVHRTEMIVERRRRRRRDRIVPG